MSWMNKQAKSIWADHKTEAFSCVIGVLVLVALVISSYVTELDPSTAVQSFTLVVLVIVTIVYAKATHNMYKETAEQVASAKEQIEVSKEAVEVAVDSQQDSVVPIIRLNAEKVDQGEIASCFDLQQLRITCKNIGNGPALNIQVWLEKVENPDFEYLPNNSRTYYSAIGVRELEHYDWPKCPISHPLPTHSSGFSIVASYTDISSRRYNSRLDIDNEHDQEFKYIRLDARH